MKPKKNKLILCLTLVLSVILFGCASQQTSPTAAKPNKFFIVSPWTNCFCSLLVSGSTNRPAAERTCRMITAKYALYASDETNGLPVFVGDPYQFYLVAITNPITRKICFTEPMAIYFATENDLIGSTLPGVGLLTCIKSFTETPAEEGLERAITEFESRCDAQTIYRWQQSNFSINLGIAAPPRFFIGQRSGISHSAPIKIETVDFTDGILRFDIKSMNLQQSGIFWVNLAIKKTVKSVINGQEMDLSASNRFAVPAQQSH